jgi:futalosine hydrolase
VRILLVSATAAEIGPVTAGLPRTGGVDELPTYVSNGHEVDVLVTGVGMVATATWCSLILSRGRYDVALNLGVCGSFDRALPLGTVVHVVTDRLSELGAEDGDAFLSIHDLHLLDENQPPFVDGCLINPAPPASPTLAGLPTVSGITVNTVHGSDQSIARVTERFAPQVESMEGAAFMYVCLALGQPFAQIRAISNVVERRNRAAWKLADAVAGLGAVSLRMLGEL